MGKFYGNQYVEADNEYDDYEYQDLVADVRELGAELDRPPSTEDAADDQRLPSLARIYEITDDWNVVLDDAGFEKTKIGRYDDEERSAMITDLQEAHERAEGHLTTREYDRLGDYAASTIKDTFGSWREACEAANVESGSRYGSECVGPHGERLESRHEREVARLLSDAGVEYRVHPDVPDTNWKCDFLLLEYELWVEVDGFPPGERPNRENFEEKLSHYEGNGMDYVVVDGPDELEAKVLD